MEDAGPKFTQEGATLRRGWTTGACAAAATKSALAALLTGQFEDPVTIALPGGQAPAFSLAREAQGAGWAEAGIVKDAGDDPDVTHGAVVKSRVTLGAPGSGITFHAGEGVGTVTKPGLPLAVGEPAINPVPRRMMREVVQALCARNAVPPDISITIAVENGAEIAKNTWNPRLGIVGGLSILGTTGIVVPYSCSAWIHSIHRGIDVARALGLTHVVGSTGDVSERAARAELGLPMEAHIDMGDFVGGMLKYLRRHPVERCTIAGGFAKLCKLAQGAMDLHSARSQVDLGFLAALLEELEAEAQLVAAARAANTANEVLTHAVETGVPLAGLVADKARRAAQGIVGENTHVSVLVTDRAGQIVGRAG